MRVCSAGHVRPLLVEKARGRMQELQSSKRLTISRLSGRRSYRHLSTSWQTSRRPSAGRPLSCIRFCLGAESATWLSVRLRCVKSHTGSRSLYACVSFTPPPRGLGHAAGCTRQTVRLYTVVYTQHGPFTAHRQAGAGPTALRRYTWTCHTRRTRATGTARPKCKKTRGGLARASATGDVHVAH